MFDIMPEIRHVVVICGRSDLRRGIDGLAAIVKLQYGLEPLKPGTLFLFCGTKRDRIKGLAYNGVGFYLLYIRLSNGKFQWPRNSDEARDISQEQYKRFMDGFSIDSSIKDYQRLK
jgi:transposase